MSNFETRTEQDHPADRLLNLLDQAYDVAGSSASIAWLVTATDALFFPNSAQEGVASDIVEIEGIEQSLERHMTRLDALLSGSEAHVSGQERVGGPSSMATLVISDDGRRAFGNAVAAKLFGCQFPCTFSQINLSESSKKRLIECALLAPKGDPQGSSVISLERDDNPFPLIARCTPLHSRGADGGERSGLAVLINYVDWHQTGIVQSMDLFGFTKAEAHLLSCFLSGHSQGDAAEVLCKSRETIRSQAKSILKKTNAKQMSEVVQMMTSFAFVSEDRIDRVSSGSPAEALRATDEVMKLPNGRRLQVNRYGLRGGRPLLFWHGLYQGPFFSEALSAYFKRSGFDVVAPSRPGMNKSDPPAKWSDYDQQVTQDVLDLCDQLNWPSMDFLVHQSGISFACRAARALKGRVGAAVMVSAGVPITSDVLKGMHIEARIGAAGIKYAPKVLEMVLRIGIAKWRRKGAHAYLSTVGAECESDLNALSDPDTGPVMERGIQHMVSGGPKVMMSHQASIVSDWGIYYDDLPAKQLWLHGAQDPVLSPQFLCRFLKAKGQRPPILYSGAGGYALLSEAEDVAARVSEFLEQDCG
ncbi:alpha/beta fold hydrolase [Pontivivens insulae]|uniref:HTH luxR-type domain-containing protein n=1 Tax=Pontivivens insulae TaxID=1639689 RepID=A0A2R8AG23_9RHOB|nr:alpha/beta fold hydrolase [Pontivivens insulae]RED10644.1 pimeloyl-ACP methyl ester carboxylesterase [Pontivivens insulae]SPF31146.1 hypothetical protein POI8812_03497 [Pontivivens insulae]